MLRRNQAKFDVVQGRVVPDRIKQGQAEYLGYAEQMLELFRSGVGRTRRDLERAVERVLDADSTAPLRRAKAFYKLLEEVSVFDTDESQKSWRLRKQVMELAAPYHPLKRLSEGLIGRDEKAVKEEIAAKVGQPWPEIEDNLFNDVMEFHKLTSFEGYSSAKELLNRYNVAQAQGVFYECTRMRVEARGDFKRILRYAKLARLLHFISMVGDSHYIFEFTGPASDLRETRRYGPNMAKFLPSLLRCQDWKMDAVIAVPWGTCRYSLSPADGLVPSWEEKKSDFDSSIEEAFVEKWGNQPREGWTLLREAEILWKDQHAFVPDFVLRHEDGRQVFLEIAGFWTKEYIEQKRANLALFNKELIVIAAPEDIQDKYRDLGRPVVSYKGRLLIGPVLEALGQVRQG
jgi:predicted nuclease of restriction endonuclease-like RecB superfamily